MRQALRSKAKDTDRKRRKKVSKKVLTSELRSDILDKLSRGSTKNLKNEKSKRKNLKKVLKRY